MTSSSALSLLQQELTRHGLLGQTVAETAQEHEGQSLSRTHEERRAQWEKSLSPQWGDMVEGWLSAGLRQAAQQSPDPAPVALAWSQALPSSFADALEVATGLALPDFLRGLVSIAAARRHGTLPIPAGSMLSSLIAAIDGSVENPPSLEAWLEDMRVASVRADAIEDRRQACLCAKGIEMELVHILEDNVSGRLQEMVNFRRLGNGIVACLPGAFSSSDFMARSGRAWSMPKDKFKSLNAGQAFPALGLAVYEGLSEKLRADDPAEQDNLKNWIVDSLRLALPHLLEQPLDTAEVMRQVRESLQCGSHIVGLAPSPRLRPAVASEDGFLVATR